MSSEAMESVALVARRGGVFWDGKKRVLGSYPSNLV